jgi:putative ABC transport system permease protein
MIKNYLVTAIRNIFRNIAFSIINILGLAIGIACVILILLWVNDELSYDKFHEKGDRIYRVITHFNDEENRIWTSSPFPLGNYMAEKYPGIETYTRFWNGNYRVKVVKYDDKIYYEDKFRIVDKNFLETFSFTLLQGNKENALKNKSSVVITETTAKKIFWH